MPWDARVASVRTGESSLGSFACGVMRARYGADVGLLAGGTFRSDQIYGPGKLRARDIMNIFPFSDPCVVLKCSGKTLLAALENGVSKYPAHEGRFPQVSGIRFAFDPSLEPGNRIVKVGSGRGNGGRGCNKKREAVSPAPPLIVPPGPRSLALTMHTGDGGRGAKAVGYGCDVHARHARLPFRGPLRVAT